MDPSDFEKLRNHLDLEARPIFRRFVAKHGLQVPEHLGRYPRLRGEKDRPDGSLVFVDFMMGLDPENQYFTSFRPDLPYELGGGLSIDRMESEGLVRYGKVIDVYRDRPFHLAIKAFEDDLENLWTQLELLSTDDCFAGRRKVI